MSKNTALVIIDVQMGLMEEGAYKHDELLANINNLLAKAHSAEVPVIYVQHNGQEGDSLEPGTPGWPIHPAIAPRAQEPVIQKQSPDAFYATLLKQELDKNAITHLVIVGEQTNYCVDTTTRSAVARGYDVTLVADAHTTCDNAVLTAQQIIDYHNAILDYFWAGDHMVRVKPTAEITF